MRALTVSTLVLLAEHSQALDVRKAARNTRRLLPNADVGVPPDATRHTIPTVNADRLNQKILQFLASGRAARRSRVDSLAAATVTARFSALGAAVRAGRVWRRPGRRPGPRSRVGGHTR